MLLSSVLEPVLLNHLSLLPLFASTEALPVSVDVLCVTPVPDRG